jgi:hypothetical protein
MEEWRNLGCVHGRGGERCSKQTNDHKHGEQLKTLESKANREDTGLENKNGIYAEYKSGFLTEINREFVNTSTPISRLKGKIMSCVLRTIIKELY